jgi:dinuclear metal center YbgI/SA1388 family protein
MLYLATVAERDEIIAYVDDLLDVRDFEDYGPNGLQVPGAHEVSVLVTGVSAHLELFDRAAALRAQMVLCHHGLLWRKQPLEVDELRKARLKALFDTDMSLVAYHLPLDAHPGLGNNALILAGLGFERAERFGDVGWVGRAADEPLARDALVDRCRDLFGQEPLVFPAGPDEVRSVGVVSGGGASALSEAVELGLDAMISGEPSEPAMAEAQEAGITFIAGGHYATETLGVRRLGELLAERFGLEHRFVEVRNPV